VHLPAHGRRGHSQAGRGSTDVEFLRRRDEVTKVSQFHGPTITKRHGGEKNKVLAGFVSLRDYTFK
jgi:hypothetical protein